MTRISFRQLFAIRKALRENKPEIDEVLFEKATEAFRKASEQFHEEQARKAFYGVDFGSGRDHSAWCHVDIERDQEFGHIEDSNRELHERIENAEQAEFEIIN